MENAGIAPAFFVGHLFAVFQDGFDYPPAGAPLKCTALSGRTGILPVAL